jgi:hypothetical protein
VEKKYRKYVLGLAAGLAMGNAQANLPDSASVMLSNFKVTLTDLAPGDGIAPAIVFAPAAYAYLNQGLSYYDYGIPWDSGNAYFDGYGDHALIASNASLHGSMQPFQLALRLATSSQSVDAYGYSNWELDFSLTPHTKALFTIDLDSAQAYGAGHTWGGMSVYDNGWASFSSEASSFEAGAMQRSLTGMVVSGGDERWRTLDLSASAAIYELAPVPEPAAYAMLLAGLSIFGWRARRRIASMPARPRPSKPNDAGSGTVASLPKNSSSLIWCM